MSDDRNANGPEHVNEVHIVGRMADDPVVRTLPSGDEIVTVRIVVNRPPPDPDSGSRGSVDTVTCTAWVGDVRRWFLGSSAGDVVEIHGALRRRFWRNASGLNNTYEVEVTSAGPAAVGAYSSV